MLRKINNLDELLEEKKRLKAQLKIVQTELESSTRRTRQEFKTLVDDKLSLSKQLGQLFQGNGSALSDSPALAAIGRAAGGTTWWGGLVVSLLPMVVNFVRRQVERRKERKLAEAAAPPALPKPEGRKLFRRKKPASDAGA
ncbi:MAG: hypothetical protein IT260_07030 [Saprospiraceae bacterium]|nr:hypothetical protein [Saprospiraceae bacterium]